MRALTVLSLSITLFLAVTLRAAQGAPEKRVERAEPRAGFSKKLLAETVPATMPRATVTSTAFASVRITAEVGADQ